MRTPPARHDLLRLDQAGWNAALLVRPDLADMPAVRAWADRLHPLISRRRQPGDPRQSWPAALALPPAQGRLRLALTLDPEHVVGIAPPPLLADAIAAGNLPAAWITKATQAAALGARFHLQPRLFGSAMWQCVTGNFYLTEQSDLDLLWPLPRHPEPAMLSELLRALEAVARSPGPRLDGEILFDGIGAVQWRELLDVPGDGEVLVKSDAALALLPRAAFLPAAPFR